MADSGDLICMLSLPGAMMDLTLRTPSDLESRVFEADSERVPPARHPGDAVADAEGEIEAST